MRADQLTWNGVSGWHAQGLIPDKANLVLYFGTRGALAKVANAMPNCATCFRARM